MFPSKLDSIPLHANSTIVLENVTSITIFNDGTMPFTVFGKTIEPNSNPWNAPYAGGYKSFDLKKIVFSGKTPIENHAKINYEIRILPTCN